jgi:hypothetical protein
MLPTGSKASSNTVLRYGREDAHAAVEADPDEAGEGRQELMRAVDCRRSRRPDLDVRTSRSKLLCYVRGLRAVEGPLRGYNDLQGGFEELERIMVRGQ